MSEYRIDDRVDDDRATYDIPVTVFMRARGVDYRDAAYGAEMLLKHALATGDLGPEGVRAIGLSAGAEINADGTTSPMVHRDVYLIGTVHRICETGMAVGNGMLWLHPTAKAYPRSADND